MKLSLSKTEYHNKPYTQPARSNMSFKGLSHNIMKAISGAMDRNSFLTSHSSKIDVNSAMSVVRNKIGTAGDVLLEHIRGDEVIKTAIKEEGGKIQFREKRPIRLILDGIIYPVAKIPFHLLYGGLNLLKKIKFIKNSNWLKKFEKSSFYSITHSYLKKDEKLHAMQGLMELGTKNDKLNAKAAEKQFLHNTAKTFDSKFGNYNGVHERALTRLVTGFIPAFYLANDAHNLSIICNNNKKDAKNEKDLRFQQESRRVLSNAYIQLITLGALSKFINKSKAWFVGVTVGTVLFTEIYSRLKTGKKIHFISSQEAKEINAKEKLKSVKEKMDKGLTFVVDEAPTPFRVSMNGVNKFIEDPNQNKFKDIIEPKKKANADGDKKGKVRSLMTLGTFAKAVGAIIVAGFAIRGLKKLPIGNGKNIGSLFDMVSNSYKKFYEKLTMKQNQITKTDMNAVMQKMKDCGFGKIADSYKKVVDDYQLMRELPNHIGDEAIEKLRALGNTKLADYLVQLKDEKAQKSLLSSLKKEKIAENLNEFVEYLKNANEVDLVTKVNELRKDGEINYSKLKKIFSKSDKYKDPFENIFAIDDNDLKLNLIKKAKTTFKDFPEIWQKVENKAKNVISGKNFYDLGKTNKLYVKTLVDFCIEPFKFFWNFVTSPYKVLFKIANLFKPTPQKGLNDIDAVAKALNSLTKKTSTDNKVFTDMFNEKIVKGFNTASMSKIANSDLSALATTASTIATMSFLISDNYNMVMLKSNGEDTEDATQKGKERFIQEMSRFLWRQIFINMFNNSFSHTYNASLLGASAVNTASTYATEICTRKAVGIPTESIPKEEILKLEKDNLSGDGIKSKFFQFMSKLTGKQIISERETKK